MQSRAYSVLAAFAVLFIGVFITTYFDLYDIIPYFDKIMHFAGGFTVAWIFLAFFNEDFRKLHPLKAGVVLISLSALIGVLWEFAEYVSDVYTPIYAPGFARYLYIGDLTDTLLDLVCDMSGGVALWIISLSSRTNA